MHNHPSEYQSTCPVTECSLFSASAGRPRMPNDAASVFGPANTCSQGQIASLEAKCCLLDLHLQAARSFGPPSHLRRPDSRQSGLGFPGDCRTRIPCTEDVLHQRLPLGSRIASHGRLCKMFGTASLLLSLDNRATEVQVKNHITVICDAKAMYGFVDDGDLHAHAWLMLLRGSKVWEVSHAAMVPRQPW